MSRAAIRYAKAVLDLAKDNGSVEAVLNDMKSVKATIEGSKELRNALNSPVIKADDKRAVLRQVFTDGTKETLGLVDVLVDNSRANLLGGVADSFIAEYNKSNKIESATVTTAVALTPELETKVLAKVKELTGSTNVTLTNEIDESIIGGFVLRVGDTQYNASIASQLGKLKREFSNSL
ncbi:MULTISPECIES: ATP synthase F1 subunit delta [Dokdonia]|jgi:F-type H+-transporting ATPase subunit delta|uniref:ATP synthase subunit delta n=2 Tax=Dokdonia TaxID=326319 RepID=A0A0A2GUR1_9FLAO|nr:MULTISPECIES: ATP synthase F1 subunit delta [Dokdonia]AOE06028.1 ATP synthase delta chain [uncultured bacterium]MDE0597819.1 ATP synthase F1 subunit delta [Dokdonia donghaensis]ANH59605.1 ATP synthase subunit delta [Dokdonia donghaensis DSW-1]EAQ39726.1 ATP synthase F1, delta subunit [Dokdonia sp. MED134]KGO06967.1 ATP synthase subunit delta [Dokdonia donghaensis DSW-1]